MTITEEEDRALKLPWLQGLVVGFCSKLVEHQRWLWVGHWRCSHRCADSSRHFREHRAFPPRSGGLSMGKCGNEGPSTWMECAPIGQQRSIDFKQNTCWKALKWKALSSPVNMHSVWITDIGKWVKLHFADFSVMSLINRTIPNFKSGNIFQ